MLLKNFLCRLKGDHVVPPVGTRASGTTEFVLSSNGTKLHYRLQVNNLRKLTQARIHLGQPGKNGPVTAYLLGSIKPGISLNTGIVTGSITSNDLIGPLQGMPLSRLVEEIIEGNAYVNVYSEFSPGGELRGPIEPIK
ncbi:CHRD domain-containing protein [Fictibacillus sp. WQ 8-8]|uniref:CHRD domain-containing protein n=1 Tax=unclassified Fictibacillus TaxID=2644029 RepID=UPI0006A7EF2C|nr:MULTISPECIES: CHRD domain-containing protein [unclassified Fictibacillus]MCQ6264836.1 CHRD domain-containing protein [Fictibacillus sp. WQ 8-8]MED2970810.1 CHRD domain-containing protein [Fictibacillus sp. B-59209]UZJ79243.1 CHRD domain-containing protein [Fictibacillus sp. KU28468]SFE87415.1 CHRD domain-containing protein [Bacillus sp. OV194]